MRPINDPQILLDQALEARERLSEVQTPLLDRLTPIIDLQVDGIPVGGESKQRVHNYERANVLALRYTSPLPTDDSLRSDLRDVYPLLAALYTSRSRRRRMWLRPIGRPTRGD
jgi:hypothetical protein